jgi:PAS domain-containing protein
MKPSDSHQQHPSPADGRAILDALPAIAWCKLPDGSNEFGLGWQAAVHPDDLPKLTEKWAEIVASGKGGEFEGRLRRRDGVFRWFLARFEPVRDDAGEIVRSSDGTEPARTSTRSNRQK